MSTNPNQRPLVTIGESSEVLQSLDQQARRVHNRGLADYVLQKAREYKGDEFRPEDLRPLVNGRFPAADAGAISNALSILARQGRGIERVGIGKTGVYRVGGTGPQYDDEAVLDQAMQALAALEIMVKRHREVLILTRTLKKALGAL